MSSKLEQALFGGADEIGKETFKDGKLIGFYAPQEVDSKLTLLAIGFGITNKSLLLRKIINEYLSQHNPLVIVTGRISRILQSPIGPEIKTKDFKSNLRKFFEEKKIDKKLIEEVLKQL